MLQLPEPTKTLLACQHEINGITLRLQSIGEYDLPEKPTRANHPVGDSRHDPCLTRPSGRSQLTFCTPYLITVRSA